MRAPRSSLPHVMRRMLILFFAIVLFGAWQAADTFLARPGERLADAGDSLLNAWILAWNHHALTAPAPSIWDAPIFYPTPGALAFSESLFGVLWLSAPVQQWSGNAALASNVVLLAAFLLNGFATYRLARTAGALPLPAVFAGLLVSFSPYLWSHAPHLQLWSLYPGILAWNFGLRFLQRGRSPDLLIAAAFLVWIFYCSIYLGLIFGTALGVFLLVYVAYDASARRHFRRPGTWLAGGAGAVVAALLVWPLARHYLEVARAWNSARTLAECATFSCELRSFFLPPEFAQQTHAWLWSLRSPVPRSNESWVFLGLVPSALVMAGLVVAFRRRATSAPALRALLVTGAVLAVLMLGPVWIWNGHPTSFPMPYALAAKLPGFAAMRVPPRFILAVLVCAGVIGALVLSAWSRQRETGWRAWLVFAAAVSLLALDYRIGIKPGVDARGMLVPGELDQLLATLPAKASLLYWPVPTESIATAGFQLEQTRHWHPLVNGTSGIFPATFRDLNARLGWEAAPDWPEVLRHSPADVFIVVPELVPAALPREKLRAEIAAAGFEFSGLADSREVYLRKASPPPRARMLSIQSLEIYVDPVSGREVAWANTLTPSFGSWFAVDGIELRGTARGPEPGAARAIPLRLTAPAFLLPGESSGSTVQPEGPLRSLQSPLAIEIQGESWGAHIPATTILLADTSAERKRKVDLRGELRLISPASISKFHAGQSIPLILEMRNTSPLVWLNRGVSWNLRPVRGTVEAVVSWQRTDGPTLAHGISSPGATSDSLVLTRPLFPNETVQVQGAFNAPREPGHYLMRIELVSHFVSWFSDAGPTKSLYFEALVEPAP